MFPRLCAFARVPLPPTKENQNQMTTTANNPLGPGINVPGREERYRDSFQRTLRDELERDPDVFIMGEDVAGGPGREHLGIIDSWGGPFAATKGLIQDFGAK